MKLNINFGLTGPKKEVNWYRELMDFPKLLSFNGSKWEWAMYNKIGNDYELTFSQIATHDPSFYADMPSFETMFEYGVSDRCVCGSAYSSFKFDHMRFCPKWKPWSQL